MKSALLHYWLTNDRGGEKVLAALAELLPEADLFTHAYRPARVPGFVSHRVYESFIARLPLGRVCPQAYLPLLPLASRALDLSTYDLIVSSESGPIKGIVKRPDQRHVCYCHTPMRYVWDMYDDYYRASGFAGRLAMRLWTPYMRRQDLKSADSVDLFVANSRFVADRIRRIYGRDSVVVYPPVNVDFFAGAEEKSDYYLLAGQLISYKRPDLALAACARMNRRLLVVGQGNQRAALMRQYAAYPNITFLGRVPDAQLKRVYGQARALLFPGVEDFGIVPVEAQAAGTPVIAYGVGGACETVRPRETGLLFTEQSVDSLCQAIETFEGLGATQETAMQSAARAWAATFARPRFQREMRAVLNLGGA